MPSINKIVVFSRYDPNITPTGTGTETTSFHTAKMYYQAVDIFHKRALHGAALVLAVAVHELPLQRLRAPAGPSTSAQHLNMEMVRRIIWDTKEDQERGKEDEK